MTEQKTINDLVAISTKKSRRVERPLRKSTLKPKYVVMYPLRTILLQNLTVDRMNELFMCAPSGQMTLDEFDSMEKHPQLERQPATEPDMDDEEGSLASCDSEELW